jgi:hypothetical protein
MGSASTSARTCVPRAGSARRCASSADSCAADATVMSRRDRGAPMRASARLARSAPLGEGGERGRGAGVGAMKARARAESARARRGGGTSACARIFSSSSSGSVSRVAARGRKVAVEVAMAAGGADADAAARRYSSVHVRAGRTQGRPSAALATYVNAGPGMQKRGGDGTGLGAVATRAGGHWTAFVASPRDTACVRLLSRRWWRRCTSICRGVRAEGAERRPRRMETRHDRFARRRQA